ncbi:MAG TPA: LamG domain-containing protein, partial [Candidatus Entotheonella sp.]
GTLITGGTLDVNGTLDLYGTMDLSVNDSDLNISGDITIDGTAGVVKGGGTVTFDGDLYYNDGVGGINLGRVVVDPTTTLTSDFTADSLQIVANDMFVTDGYEMTIIGTLDIDGTLDASSGTDGASTITVGGTWDMSGGIFINTASTVILNGTQSSSLISGGQTFNHLIINDGLIGYWKFDETAAGSFADASGYANTGTGLGATGSNNTPQPSVSTPVVNFADRRALDFDGTNDRVEIDDDDYLDISGNGTIAAWARRDAAGVWHSIVAKGDANFNYLHNYGLEIRDVNTVTCIIGNGTTDNVLDSVSTIAGDQQYHHFACTWDGSNLRVYIDGVQNNSVAQTITPQANTSPLYIGQFGGDVDYFDGAIDDVRIYNRALSAQEIARLAQGNQPSTGVATINLQDALDVNGTLVLATGNLVTGNNNVTIGESYWNYGGIYNAGSQTTTFNTSSAGQVIQSNGILESFDTVVLDGSGAWRLNDNITASGTINLDGGTLTHTSDVVGITMTGSLEVDGGVFTGTGSGFLIDGNLSLLSGTFTAPDDVLLVTGNWLRTAATFNDNGGVVILSSENNQTVTSNTESFYDLTIGGGLVGYWKLDEAAFNTCNGGADDFCDSSGNGYHGDE